MNFTDWLSSLFSLRARKRRRSRRSGSSLLQRQTSAEVLEARTLLTAQISIAPVAPITEGQNATFVVTLSEAASNTVTVDFSTEASDGPTAATAGEDFNAQTNQRITFNPGEVSKAIGVSTINDSIPEQTETFEVVLSNASGAPIVVNRATATINDNDGAQPTVSIADATPATEGQNASFTVTLSAAASGTVSVRYSTVSGAGPTAATSGLDFTAASNATLTFAPGETEKTINVATTDDQETEADEVFTISLSSPTGVVLADREATGTILDNDSGGGLPAISISDAPAITEGANAVFTVTLTSAATTAVTLNYSTFEDNRPTSAGSGDFTARTNQSLTFAAGELTKTIVIATIDDIEVEDTETFGVMLSNVSGATLSTAQAIGTINDNEVALPEFSVNNAPAVEEGGSASFVVTLDRAVANTLTVNYSTASGFGPSGASNNADFTAINNQMLTFSPGQTQRTVTVVTTDDALIESTEQFQLNLTSPSSGSRIATAQGLGTIYDNDGTAGFAVSKTSVTVEESGTTDTFTVSLITAPTSNVVFNLGVSSSDRPSPIVTPAQLTFTPSNWAVAQTVTVQGVNDVLPDGDQTSEVTVSVDAGASDNRFDNLASQFVTVTTVDDDVAEGLQITGPLGAIDNQQPTLTWTPVAGAVSYDVELFYVSGGNTRLIKTTVSGTSLASPSVLGVGRYRTWVRATLGTGTQTSWESEVFTVQTTTAIHAIDFHGTDRTPTFTWDAVEGAAQYRVFLSNQTTGGAAVADQMVSGTSFTASPALNFGRYLFWVRPVAADGFEAAWSTSEDYYIGPTLLTPLGSTLQTQPQFTWTAIPGAATYHLYVAGPGGVLVNEPGITGTSYTPASALADGDFRWWIKPSTSTGAGGAWSEVARFSTGGRTRVNLEDGTVTSSIPVFDWPAVSGAQSYEVYVSRIGTPGALYRQAGLPGTTYSSPALDNGDYKIWIRTVQSDGTPVWGSGAAFTVNENHVNLNTVPLSPTTPTFGTTPEFRWAATSGAVSYDIMLHNGTDARLESNLTGTTWTPSPALTSGDWTWRIRSRNSSGATGPWSTASGFSTSGRTVLLAPGSTTSNRTPTFTWQSVTGATRYILQVDNLTTGADRVIREDNLTGTAFTPSAQLTPGTYRAWVRSISSASTAPWSLQLDFVVT